MSENESTPAANPEALAPSSATFTLISVCANPGQVEIEFDKKEIDFQASDAGVMGSCGGDVATTGRRALAATSCIVHHHACVSCASSSIHGHSV